ncbi:MAG TPA: division/cell wall cluster transcriptional repressor MraZ [Thermomicrobiales bacterium]|nr:division/cell wall cluster transcriptional repressor MraZ [Thermomicrobiales bacterium]
MFLGRHSHNLDDKGRLALPARYREELRDGVVITRGFDNCLLIYPMAAWAPLAERVSALSIGDPDVRLLRRMLFANASDLLLDRQGRILVPAELRTHAGLEREAVVVGMHSFIEIWSPEGWAGQDELVERDGASIAEKLAALV